MQQKTGGDLSSGDPWTRAMALYTMDEEDLRNVDDLVDVLSLLGDRSKPEPPPGGLSEKEMELARDFGLPVDQESAEGHENGHRSVPPQLCSMEMMVPPSRYYSISDLAQEFLEGLDLPASDDVLAGIVYLVENRRGQERDDIIRWLDDHLFDFPWRDPGEVFKAYYEAQAREGRPFIVALVSKLDQEVLAWLADRAAGPEKTDPRLLQYIIENRGNEGAMAVLEALEGKDVDEMDPEMIPILDLIAQEEQLSERALRIMRGMEEDALEATGFLALRDAGARERFGERLEEGEPRSPDPMILDKLVGALEDRGPPEGFPMTVMIPRCRGSTASRIVGLLEDDVEPETVREAALAFTSRQEDFSEAFDLLYTVARRGMFKEDPDGAGLLWKSLEARLREPDVLDPDFWIPPSFNAQRSSSMDFEHEKKHPLIVLSDPEIRPPGFEEALLHLLKEGLVLASVVARGMPEWEPVEEGREIVARAIVNEVQRFEDIWEKEKDARREEPEAFRYDDAKAPTGVLMMLERRWEPLVDLAYRIDLEEEVIGRMRELIELPWQEALREISSSGSEKIGAGEEIAPGPAVKPPDMPVKKPDMVVKPPEKQMVQKVMDPGTGRDMTGEYVTERLEDLRKEADELVTEAVREYEGSPERRDEIFQEYYYRLHDRIGQGSIGPATAAAGPLLYESQRRLAEELDVEVEEMDDLVSG